MQVARTPWVDAEALATMERIVHPGCHVFEWGAGGSTLWFGLKGARVRTVEHAQEWHDAVLTELRPLNLPVKLLFRLLEPPTCTSYVNAVLETPQTYDLVFVDGRQRVQCFRTAIDRVNSDGYILLHDSERGNYAECRNIAAEHGFTVSEIVEARSLLLCRRPSASQ